jgi:hypothetical protein
VDRETKKITLTRVIVGLVLMATLALCGWVGFELYKSYKMQSETDEYVQKTEELQEKAGEQAKTRFLSTERFCELMGVDEVTFPLTSVRFKGNLEQGRCVAIRKARSGDKEATGEVIFSVRNSELALSSASMTFEGKTVDLLKGPGSE